jgi:hypothetical protein
VLGKPARTVRLFLFDIQRWMSIPTHLAPTRKEPIMTTAVVLPFVPEPATLPLEQNISYRLEQEGWQVGPPAHVSAASVRIDTASCKRRRCRQCQRRTLDFVPYHLGARYKGIATCIACLASEEV